MTGLSEWNRYGEEMEELIVAKLLVGWRVAVL